MLTTAYKAAVSGLNAQSDLASVTSRNIAASNTPGAVRRYVATITGAYGGATTTGVARQANLVLAERMRAAVSEVAQYDALAESLTRIGNVMGAEAGDYSPADQLGEVQAALTAFASTPNDWAAASSAVEAARGLVESLGRATDELQAVRQDADKGIADAVTTLRDQLDQFSRLNTMIVKGMQSGQDVTDAQDQRDQLLSEMSDLIGIKTLVRQNDDVVIMTESGTILFETVPREISFEPSGTLPAGVAGGQVLVDGSPLARNATGLRDDTGRLPGLLQLRDEIVPTLQAQLDEVARGVIVSFAETDQTGGGGAAQPGLFTYAGATGLPAAGVASPGLAGRIMINAAVDPTVGGDPMRLRDGGMTGPDDPAYIYNTSGSDSYSERLEALVDALSADQTFDPATGLQGTASLLEFSDLSIGWLESRRQSISTAQIGATALKEQSTTALTNATGISLDDEMTRMLDIERSYQASARMISTIDTMFKELFSATG